MLNSLSDNQKLDLCTGTIPIVLSKSEDISFNLFGEILDLAETHAMNKNNAIKFILSQINKETDFEKNSISILIKKFKIKLKKCFKRLN